MEEVINAYVDSRDKYCQLIRQLHERNKKPDDETKALADWLVRQHIEFYQKIADRVQGFFE